MADNVVPVSCVYKLTLDLALPLAGTTAGVLLYIYTRIGRFSIADLCFNPVVGYGRGVRSNPQEQRKANRVSNLGTAFQPFETTTG